MNFIKKKFLLEKVNIDNDLQFPIILDSIKEFEKILKDLHIESKKLETKINEIIINDSIVFSIYLIMPLATEQDLNKLVSEE